MQEAKKVLIIEDDQALLNALVQKLQHAGFGTAIALDGAEGLDRLKQGTYDLILLDLLMPSMDGFEFLKELQGQGNRIPIAVISNLSQQEDVKKTKELGAEVFFVKAETPLTEIVAFIQRRLN